MINEPPSKTWVVIIVAIIGAVGVIIAAIIKLGMPFAERIADQYYPPLTAVVVVVTSTPAEVHPNGNPTSLPPAAQKPSQTNFPDITVSANANNGVQFVAPTTGNYQFTIKEGTYCTPSICRSIIHGYLGRDVVWKDFYGLPHPMEQD